MSALQTFRLPGTVRECDEDTELGRAMIRAWQADGIFQVEAAPDQESATRRALDASRAFFKRPLHEKAACISDATYSGYVASDEEETAGRKDGSEIFTVCPDIPAADARVADRWPCHGSTPWPSLDYAGAMREYMRVVGEIGHRLLQLTALGLGLKVADSQVPWGVAALNGAVNQPAWRTKPSWYLVSSGDRMIHPPVQRAMAERAGAQTVEVPGSHSVYVSQPGSVADLIKQAAGR